MLRPQYQSDRSRHTQLNLDVGIFIQKGLHHCRWRWRDLRAIRTVFAGLSRMSLSAPSVARCHRAAMPPHQADAPPPRWWTRCGWCEPASVARASSACILWAKAERDTPSCASWCWRSRATTTNAQKDRRELRISPARCSRHSLHGTILVNKPHKSMRDFPIYRNNARIFIVLPITKEPCATFTMVASPSERFAMDFTAIWGAAPCKCPQVLAPYAGGETDVAN